MNKYDEIMKEINLTPEAKERILENVCREMEGETRVVTTTQKRNLRRYLTTAACCVLVIAGAIAASNSGFIDGLLGGDSAVFDEETKQEAAYESEPESEASKEFETVDGAEPAGSSEEAEGEVMEGETPDGSAERGEAVDNTELKGAQGSDSETGDSQGEVTDNAGSEEGTDKKSSESEDLQEQTQEIPRDITIAGNSSKSIESKDYSKGADNAKEIQYFGSLEELNDHLGFTIDPGSFEDICLNKGMTEIEYLAYGESIGEVRYRKGKTINYYRKGMGDENLAWDEGDYDLFMEFDGIDRSGSISGHKNKYQLAEWGSIDGFSYAALYKDGLSDKKWFEIINESGEESE